MVKRQAFLLAALLILIAALCYLPLAHRFGFYNDDWYLLYAWDSVQGSQGNTSLMEVFAGDRPLRGVFVAALFELLGTNVWLYSLSAFAWRVAGALGVWWLLRRLSGRSMVAYLAALLFVVYPGFLDQPNAVDYQSHQIAFALEIFSLLLSVQAVDVRATWLKIILIVFASLMALLSFLLMEYYIGLEGLRFLLLLAVCTLVAAGQTGWWRRLQHTLAHFALPLLVSMGFFYWRVAIFQGERLATDISAIAEDLAGSPALRGLWILVRLFQDMLNVLFVAWAEPLYRLAFPLRLKHFLLASGIGIVAAGLALLAVFLFFGSDGTGFLSRFSSKATGDHKGVDAQSASVQLGRSLPPGQLILLGLLAVAFALVPIHFGSRHVLFDGFSRFTLTASVGMAFFLSGMLAVISPRVRVGLAITLIGLAGMVHTANAIHYAENWEVVRNFWWQVSWRVPQIEPGTLLIASYADQGIAEDYFIWGPANLIYYPDQQTQLPITLTLTAATINTSDLYKVLSGGREERMRRGVYSEKDFSQVLVLSLPSPHACVHVLDSNRPELSIDDRAEISLLASVSDIGLVRLDETLMTPPAAIFGRPPAANWCFYYQKASLARQEGNWDEVSRLGNEAVAQGIRPYDWIEWLPFAQAYAYTGQPDRLHETAAVLRTEPIYLQEACELMRADVYRDADEYPEGHQQLIDELCRPLE